MKFHLLPFLAATAASFASEALPEKVTFNEHVAPILYTNCAVCHRPGEIAPFSLLSYADAKKRAKQIAEITTDRTMPPWHADRDNPAFTNDRSLSDRDVALLAAWARGGAAEGEAAKLRPAPKFTEGWAMGTPDVELKMPEAYEVPAEGRDTYRNFVLPLNFQEDKWISSLELRPSAPAVVHHVLIFLDTDGSALKRDAQDPQPGYNGFNSNGLTYVVGWAPGAGPLELPEDLAWKFPKGANLVLQAHISPKGKLEREATAVGLRFAKKPPERLYTTVQIPPLFGMIQGIDIPPGAKEYTLRDSFVMPIDGDAWAVGAHAHYRGKRMNMTATLPDGTVKTLLKISDWDFAWQEQYGYRERIALPKGTRLDSEIVWDNSAENPRNPAKPPVPVRWGVASADEMGSVVVGVVPRTNDDIETLKTALTAHIADLMITAGLNRLDLPPGIKRRLGDVTALLATFDTNKDGQLDDAERGPLRTMVMLSGMPRQMLNSSP
jgi:mono/diheme cytochrome c family protein